MNDEDSVLAEFGVTPIECAAFVCPYYELAFNLKRMASESFLENVDRKFTADEFYVALQGMIAKGWLQIQGDSTAEREQVASETLPKPDGCLVPRAGGVTFTRYGYVLFRRMRRRLRGMPFVRSMDRLELDEGEAGVRKFYAPTIEQCIEWLEEHSRGKRMCDIEILSTTGPDRVGPWRRNRFRVVRGGWIATARYRLLSESERYAPFVVSGLPVEGRIELLPPIAITGTVEGHRFRWSQWTATSCNDGSVSRWWSFKVEGPRGRKIVPGSILSSEAAPAGTLLKMNFLFNREIQVAADDAEPLGIDEATRLAEKCLREYLS